MSQLPPYIYWTNRKTVPNKVQIISSAFQKNCNNSAYARHLINSGHAIGYMEDIIDVVCRMYKGRQFDTTEKYYVFVRGYKRYTI